jgi:hypothetical protein
MDRFRVALVLVLMIASVAFACSATDPGGLAFVRRSAGTPPASTGTAPPSESPPPPQSMPPPPSADAGAAVDAAPSADAASDTQTDDGSCTSPLCGSLDAGYCGCKALSGASTYLMGCAAGGQCVCLIDQQVSNQGFDENGACGSVTTMQQAFVTNCTCP